MTMTQDIDLLKTYIGDMERYPLLTHEQEIQLAKRVQDGDESAKAEFMNANLRLVINIARRYQGGRVALLDLIQEGNIGLHRAVEKYDPDLGYKFSTYAVPWISQAINRAQMRYGRSVRLPFGVTAELRRMRTQIAELGNELGREPAFIEIADHLGIDPAELGEKMALMQDVSTLDVKLNGSEEDGGMTYAESVADKAPSVEDEVVENDTNATLMDALQSLPERERRILCLRYGLGGVHPLSLELVGREFGITRERVRQLEMGALEKLRKSGLVLR
jgi:RNA polymerase primary sigma factor